MKQTTQFLFGFLVMGLFLFSMGCGSSNKATTTPTSIGSITPDLITATAQKANVLYLGVENPVQLHLPSKALNTAKLTVSNNATVKHLSGRKTCTITVKEQGEVILTISGKGFKKQISFRVKPIPNPIAKLGGKTSGRITKSELRGASGLSAHLENFDFDVRCVIVSYKLIYARSNATKLEKVSRNNRFTSDIKVLLHKAKQRDTYIFSDIKARCAGDKNLRKISPMVFTVR